MDTKFSIPSMGLGSALIRQKGWALVGDCLGTSLTLDERLSSQLEGHVSWNSHEDEGRRKQKCWPLDIILPTYFRLKPLPLFPAESYSCISKSIIPSKTTISRQPSWIPPPLLSQNIVQTLLLQSPVIYCNVQIF